MLCNNHHGPRLNKYDHSVQEGLCPGGLCPGWVSVQGDLCPRGSMSRGFFVQRGSPSRGGSLSREISVQGYLCPWGLCLEGSLSRRVLSRGVSVQGSLSRGVSVIETPHTVTYGQYVSYWNAFLFFDLNFNKVC